MSSLKRELVAFSEQEDLSLSFSVSLSPLFTKGGKVIRRHSEEAAVFKPGRQPLPGLDYTGI